MKIPVEINIKKKRLEFWKKIPKWRKDIAGRYKLIGKEYKNEKVK